MQDDYDDWDYDDINQRTRSLRLSASIVLLSAGFIAGWLIRSWWA